MAVPRHPAKQSWEHVTADFLEMPPTKHPFLPGLWDELLVVVDTFSKQIVLIQIEITSVAQRHQEFTEETDRAAVCRRLPDRRSVGPL